MQDYKQPESGLGSLAETNRLLEESSKQTGIAAPDFSRSDVINSESLSGSTSPVVIPPTTISTTAEGLSGMAQVMVEQNKLAQEQELRAQEAQKGVTEEKGKLTGLMDKILGVQSSRSTLEEEARLGQKAQKVTDVTNQIEASQRAQTNELRALAGAGLNDVQRAAQSREINRKYAFEQADLALIQSAANRDLDTASRIIDRKIQLQLEPLQTQLDFTKFFYQENKELFTKAEDRAFTQKINQLNQQYQTESANRTAIANIQLEALKNGVNIPSSVMAQLNTAKDAAQATSILASNGISLVNPLEAENKRLTNLKLAEDINKTRAEKEKIIKETAATTDTAKAQLQQFEALSLAQELRKPDAIGKRSAVGASAAKLVPFGQALGLQGKRAAFENKVSSLKSNLTLENLKLLKGAMSDKDLLFLNSIGSSLSTDMDEASFDAELDKVINKLKSATGVKGEIVNSPDGLIEITD